jgi:hypothetical protein
MLFVLFFLGSIAFAMMVPRATKRAHVRRQDRLLDRCRALYVLAVQAFELEGDVAARSYLLRIRRLEARWRYGNSIAFRVALALWGIGAGVVGYILLRIVSLLAFSMDYRPITADEVRRIAIDGQFYLLLAFMASLHAFNSYLGEWTNWWRINNCGDRLEQILNAQRHVATTSDIDEMATLADGLTSRQIFGLAPGFTRRQLDRARRRLVTKLHPDLWPNATPAFRRAREEALKRVNAAYDQLRASAV